MTRDEYLIRLEEMLMDDEWIRNGSSDFEIIYMIDDLVVYGGYEEGIRGIDHNILIFDNVDISDVIRWGIIVTPETKSYISDSPVERLDAIQYTRMPIVD